MKDFYKQRFDGWYGLKDKISTKMFDMNSSKGHDIKNQKLRKMSFAKSEWTNYRSNIFVN